jgi:hypothetical protein
MDVEWIKRLGLMKLSQKFDCHGTIVAREMGRYNIKRFVSAVAIQDTRYKPLAP